MHVGDKYLDLTRALHRSSVGVRLSTPAGLVTRGTHYVGRIRNVSGRGLAVAGNDDFRLEPQTRALLERWIRSPSSQQRAVRRSRIILALDEGLSVTAVAAREGIGRRTVALWKARFQTEGPKALLRDRPRAAGWRCAPASRPAGYDRAGSARGRR